MAAVTLLYALGRDGIADTTSHLIISVSNTHLYALGRDGIVDTTSHLIISVSNTHTLRY
jgi:hypothetical protein